MFSWHLFPGKRFFIFLVLDSFTYLYWHRHTCTGALWFQEIEQFPLPGGFALVSVSVPYATVSWEGHTFSVASRLLWCVSWRSVGYVFLLGLNLKEEPICASGYYPGISKRTMVTSHDGSACFSLEVVIVTLAYILFSKLSPWLNLMSMGWESKCFFSKGKQIIWNNHIISYKFFQV